MIERLCQEALSDTYLSSLYRKANELSAATIFRQHEKALGFTQKELSDILRFSDILSNSKTPIARNRAYNIITLLNAFYSKDPYYRTFAHSVLAKLGNFPGIAYLEDTNNNFAELPYERNLEKNIKKFVQAVPDTDGLVFTDSQFELYQKISTSKFFSFSGPTSMGKSFIIKSFIRKAISNSPPENIVIMVPTRALINQFSIDLNKELRLLLEHYNYKIATNSSISELQEGGIQHHYLLVLTPERLISYLSQKNNPPINYLFVDEAHKLAAENDSRSITAYAAIARAIKHNPTLNLYFASPNVSNPEIFLKLFAKDETQSHRTIESPVSQNLFFLDLVEKKVLHYTDTECYSFESEMIQKGTSFLEVLTNLGQSDNNIIYCSSRFQAIEKALLLYNYKKSAPHDVSKNIKKAINQIKSYIHKDYYLCDFLAQGIAYHFGNLPQIIRNKVEDLFKNSEIKFIFCTSTLLEGVIYQQKIYLF